MWNLLVRLEMGLHLPPGSSSLLKPTTPLDGLPVDPYEPTYCICNEVSYGEMIGCDNENVRYSFLFIFSCIQFKIGD
jgi:inhibitor of growth protein 4